MNYTARIKKVQSFLKEGELLLLFGAGMQTRNSDVEYKFRQDSDFYYLTGHDEPDAVLVLARGYSAAFVLPREKAKEIWTGTRVGREAVKKRLGLTESFELGEWDKKKEELFTGKHTLWYFFGNNPERDIEITGLCATLARKLRDGRVGPTSIRRPVFLHEMRMVKSPEEIGKIRTAAGITRDAHIRLMKETRPGMNECELEAILESEFLRSGAWGGGYGHIVAGGKNATILHYTANNQPLKKEDLVLVDSGAEKDYYTADVTRTFPVGERFSREQQEIYEIVLNAQKAAIDKCRAGNTFAAVHESALQVIVKGLVGLGLLKGTVSSNIKKGTYKKYYMHKIGHWLGMDVHDVGSYFSGGKSRALKNGYVLTVEPGLYFDTEDKSIPKKYRGIGIRIEDNILVKGNTPENLTEMIPKEIQDIEALRII